MIRFRRSTLILVDQLVSSGTNLVWLAAAGLVLSGSGFGAFTLGWNLFAVGLGAVRYTSSERISRDSGSEHVALWTHSVLGVVLLEVIGLLVVGAITGARELAIWAAACPLILFQDRLRYVAIRQHPWWTVWADVLWLLVIAATLSMHARGHISGFNAVLLSSTVGPLLSGGVLAVAARSQLFWRLDPDIPQVRREAPFVVDGWILAAAVFAAQLMVGAIGSLETVGAVGTLLLVFQPFYSMSYAGRWIVVSASASERLRVWPIVQAVLAVAYCVLVGVLLMLVHRVWALPPVWHVGTTVFVIAAVGQVARAYHGGLADLARRGSSEGLVSARVTFAVCLVTTTIVLVPWLDLEGAVLSQTIAFVAAASVAARRVARQPLTLAAPSSVRVGGQEAQSNMSLYQGEAGRKYHERVHALPDRADALIASARAEKFASFVSSSAVVVEFGVGPGWNLAGLSCRERIGVDVAESLADRLQNTGIRFVTEASVVPDAHADVVICHHMLEHVEDPVSTLREMRRVLKLDGRLLLYVPFEQRRSARRFDPDEPNHHLYSWNVQTMAALAASQGFEVLHAGLGPSGYDRFAAAAAIRTRSGSRGFRVVRAVLRAIRPVREVRVIARRAETDTPPSAA